MVNFRVNHEVSEAEGMRVIPFTELTPSPFPIISGLPSRERRL
jgi:hypothetical protein